MQGWGKLFQGAFAKFPKNINHAKKIAKILACSITNLHSDYFDQLILIFFILDRERNSNEVRCHFYPLFIV